MELVFLSFVHSFHFCDHWCRHGRNRVYVHACSVGVPIFIPWDVFASPNKYLNEPIQHPILMIDWMTERLIYVTVMELYACMCVPAFKPWNACGSVYHIPFIAMLWFALLCIHGLLFVVVSFIVRSHVVF